MSSDSRRRLGAITALVARSVRRADAPAVPAHRPDRPFARSRRSGSSSARARSGSRCWASGSRSPASSGWARLDMKRSAFLIIGLSVLLPYLIGVLFHVTVADLDRRGRVPGPDGWRRARLLRGPDPARHRGGGRGTGGLPGAVAPSPWPRSPGIRCSGWSASPTSRTAAPSRSRRSGEKAEGKRKAAKDALDAGGGSRPGREELRVAKAESKADAKGDGKSAKGRPARKPEPRRAAGREGSRPRLGRGAARGPAHQGHRCRRGRARRAAGAARGDTGGVQGRGRRGRPHHRAGRDAVRRPAPARRQDEPAGEPRRRPGAQDERALDPRGPHSRAGHGGRRGAESEGARGGAARAAGGRAVVGRGAAAAGDAGARPRGPAGHRGSGEDAAPPDRGRHRHRQVGRDQRDHHVAHLPLPAQGGSPPPDDRPEDGRAVHVQGPAPSPAPGRHQQQGGRAGAQVGRGRDGAALRAARGQRRPQHERLQPQGARRQAAQASSGRDG